MMNRSFKQIGLTAACAVLALLGSTTPALAAETDGSAPADRIERLEKRINELAQRQEQLMRRLGAQQEQQAPMAEPGQGNFRARRAGERGTAIRQSMPPVQGPEWAGAPALRGPRPEAAKRLKDLACLLKLIFLVALIFNILLAIWIYTDIRKQGQGSGIFIALALLAGVPAAIIYAIVRIGDKKT
jgi:hypothetical protein